MINTNDGLYHGGKPLHTTILLPPKIGEFRIQDRPNYIYRYRFHRVTSFACTSLSDISAAIDTWPGLADRYDRFK